MSCASAGMALPANSASVSLLLMLGPRSRAAAPQGLSSVLEKTGWGGRIRTSEWRDQNPLPYHLATPQLGKQPTTGFSRSAILQARASHSVPEPESLQTLAASCASFVAQDPWSHRPKTHRPQCQSGGR